MFERIFPPGRGKSRLILAIGASCLSAFAVGWVVWFSDSGPKYMRSDCIVRLRVTHPPGSDIRTTETRMFEAFTDYAMENKLSVSTFSYGYSDRSNVYVVFWNYCEEKFELTKRIVEFYSLQYPDDIRVEITRDVVQPSMDTVIVDGETWIDGTPKRRHELGLE